MSFLTGLPEKEDKFNKLKELKNIKISIVDGKSSSPKGAEQPEEPTNMKDLGLGNHV